YVMDGYKILSKKKQRDQKRSKPAETLDVQNEQTDVQNEPSNTEICIEQNFTPDDYEQMNTNLKQQQKNKDVVVELDNQQIQNIYSLWYQNEKFYQHGELTTGDIKQLYVIYIYNI